MATTTENRGRKANRKPSTASVHPDLGNLNPPAELTGAALAEWHRVVPLLAGDKRLTPLDLGVLARYCQARADWAESVATYETLADSVVKTPKGGFVVHPVARMRYRIAGEMRECEKVLGLSPLSREKIRPPEKVTEEESDIEAYIAEGARIRENRGPRSDANDRPEEAARPVGPQRQHDVSNAG